jgi:hypothetical protein
MRSVGREPGWCSRDSITHTDMRTRLGGSRECLGRIMDDAAVVRSRTCYGSAPGEVKRAR